MRRVSKLAASAVAAAMMISSLAVPACAEITNPTGLNSYNEDQPYFIFDLDEAAKNQGFELTDTYGFNFYFTWVDESKVGDCLEQLSYNSYKGDTTDSDWQSVATNLSFKVAEDGPDGTKYIQYMSEEPLFEEPDKEFAEIQAESYYCDYTVEYVELLDKDGNVIATITAESQLSEGTGSVAPVVAVAAIMAVSAAVIVSKKRR